MALRPSAIHRQGNGLDWVLEEKKLSAENKITAPRIFAYTAFGMGAKKEITTPQEAIQWVQDNAKKGADGIKFFGAPPLSWMPLYGKINGSVYVPPVIMRRWM